MSKNLSKDELSISIADELKINQQTANSVLSHMGKKIFENLSAYGEITLTGFGAPITVKQKSKTERSQANALRKEPRLSVLKKKSQPGTEQRKLERRNFILDIEIAQQTTQQVLGNLGDITAEGIMLVSDQPIAENTLFPMVLTLPPEADEELEIIFEATSIRCQKTIHENIYITGFKIEALDEESRQKVEYFIREYAV